MVAFCHSAVLPSGASKRARGTRTVTGPKVPISPRWRWPCRASPHNRPAAYAGLGKPRPFIPVPPQRNVEFRFQEFLDEAANAGPHPGFHWIEPMARKEKCSFGRVRRRCDPPFVRDFVAHVCCDHTEVVLDSRELADR